MRFGEVPGDGCVLKFNDIANAYALLRVLSYSLKVCKAFFFKGKLFQVRVCLNQSGKLDEMEHNYLCEGIPCT